MTPQPSQQSSRLWVCHRCEMIGSEAQAKAHEIARGHDIRELDADTSEGIREAWMADMIDRAGDFVAAAKTGKRSSDG